MQLRKKSVARNTGTVQRSGDRGRLQEEGEEEAQREVQKGAWPSLRSVYVATVRLSHGCSMLRGFHRGLLSVKGSFTRILMWAIPYRAIMIFMVMRLIAVLSL